eukprot:gb/GEZJ01008274.1/.p1 GENE.gb/GEZJ01008274.1/~~gb/GEZJ01008274.1/.p1  ORF type:complete len:225 (+),score=27.42 gb/GEZJ01008274.1/:472-1146(+)
MKYLFALCVPLLFNLIYAYGDESSHGRVMKGIYVPKIPFSTKNVRTELCLLLNGRNLINEEFSFDFEAADTLFACSEKRGRQVVHFPGRLNLRSSEFVCEKTPLISYSDDDDFAELIPFHLPFVCVDDICVFYKYVRNRVFLSAAVLREEAPKLRGQYHIKVPFLETKVLYDFDSSMVEKFAKNQAHAFKKGVTGSIDLRAMSYLGTTKARCQFPRLSCTCNRR